MRDTESQVLQNLKKYIRDWAVIRNSEKPIRMASGKTTDIYFNMKGVSLRGEGLSLVSIAFMNCLQRVATEKEFLVAGVSVGGDPLVAGVILASFQAATESGELNRVSSGLLVRKEAKSHGASQGLAVDGEKPSKKKVWLLEDVISTGQSSLKALKNLEIEKYNVEGVLVIVDREMGGFDSLRREYPNLQCHSLFKMSEFV
jgi:orotate phosphoribosyltransferase